MPFKQWVGSIRSLLTGSSPRKNRADALQQSLFWFCGHYTWTRSRAVLIDTPDLLSEEACDMARAFIAVSNPFMASVTRQHLEILQRCRSSEVDIVFDELVKFFGPIKLRQNTQASAEELFELCRRYALDDSANLLADFPDLVSREADDTLAAVVNSDDGIVEPELLSAFDVVRKKLARFRMRYSLAIADGLYQRNDWANAYTAYISAEDALSSSVEAHAIKALDADRRRGAVRLRRIDRNWFERREFCRTILGEEAQVYAPGPSGYAPPSDEMIFNLRTYDAAVLHGDRAFEADDWATAAESYSQAIRHKQLAAQSPDSAAFRDALRGQRNHVYRHHCFALTKLGRVEEAVEALEDGKTQLLAELLLRQTESDDDSWLRVQGAADHLADKEAAMLNPILRDRVSPEGVKRWAALRTLLESGGEATAADRAELARVEEGIAELARNPEAFEQLVLPDPNKLSLNLNPTSNKDIADRMSALRKAMKRVFDKYASAFPRPPLEDEPDEIAVVRREFLEALQQVESENPSIATTLRAALAIHKPDSEPERATTGEIDDSFDWREYSKQYSLNGHTILPQLTEHPVLLLNCTRKGTNCLLVSISDDGSISIASLVLPFDTNQQNEILGRREQSGYSISRSLDRQLSADPETNEPRSLASVKSICNNLGDRLMRDVVSWVLECNHKGCVLIPTGQLALLPLHAAYWTIDEVTERTLDLLEVTWAPSIRLFAQARLSASKVKGCDLIAIHDVRPTALPPLPFAAAEVEIISKRFLLPWGQMWMAARVMSEKNASRVAVEGCLGNENIIHFACHAMSDETAPHRGGIILSGDEPLTSADFIRKYCPSRLAVLSGCQTAIAGSMQSDETVSPPAALLAAGYAGAVGSLWKVSDVSTAILMIKFYEEWFDFGQPPPAALRRAQTWISGARRSELAAYFSPDKLPWYAERLPAPARDDMQKAWAQILANVSEGKQDDLPFANPFYWAAFCAYGV